MTAAGALSHGEGSGGVSGAAVGGIKDPRFLGRGRGGLTAAADRRMALEILDGAVCGCARAREAGALLGVGPNTSQRLRTTFLIGPG